MVGKGMAVQHFYITQYNLEEYLFYFIQSQKSGFEGAQLYGDSIGFHSMLVEIWLIFISMGTSSWIFDIF